LIGPDILKFVLVFVSRDFQVGTLRVHREESTVSPIRGLILSGMVCHPRARTCYDEPAYQIWSLLTPPTMTIGMATQNVEN